MKRLLWPLELDRYVSESSLKAAKHKLTEAERKGIDKALDEFLAAELDAVKRFSRGEPAERLLAYEKATALATVYKGRDEADKAQELAKELARDAKFKRELAAKAAFQKLMRKAGDNPAAQSRAMGDGGQDLSRHLLRPTGRRRRRGPASPSPLRREPAEIAPRGPAEGVFGPAAGVLRGTPVRSSRGSPCTPTRASGSFSSATFPISLSATPSSPNWTECTTSFASCTDSIRPSASGTGRPSCTPSFGKRIFRSLRRCSPSKNGSFPASFAVSIATTPSRLTSTATANTT